MEKHLEKLKAALPGIHVKEHESLSLYTSLHIGGPARYYIEVETISILQQLLAVAQNINLPVFVLGSGSNILFGDQGFSGLVIKNNCRKFDIMSMIGKIKQRQMDVSKYLITAESGALLNQVIRFSLDQGLSGLERGLGLPGTIGGFMKQNVVYRSAVIDPSYVYNARVFSNGEVKVVQADYFMARGDNENEDVLLSVVFSLPPLSKEVVWEKATAFATRRQHIAQERYGVYVFADISQADAMRIPTPGHTTSPEYLIESVGLKGKRIGDAMVSESHANTIVNNGTATAHDVHALISLIQKEVKKKYALNLKPIVKYGEFEVKSK